MKGKKKSEKRNQFPFIGALNRKLSPFSRRKAHHNQSKLKIGKNKNKFPNGFS